MINLQEIELLEKKIFSQPFSLKQLEEMYRNENYKFYVLKENDKIVAYLILHNCYDVHEIIKIAVDEKKRKNGLGEKLIKWAFNEITTPLFLEVRKNNIAAQNLYKKIGFEIVGERKGYYQDTGENAILMTLNK
jgi:ribosomal-protein-alanine N-acetyltransferase